MDLASVMVLDYDHLWHWNVEWNSIIAERLLWENKLIDSAMPNWTLNVTLSLVRVQAVLFLTNKAIKNPSARS